MTCDDEAPATEATCIDGSPSQADSSEDPATGMLRLRSVLDLQAAAPLAREFAERRGHFVVVNGEEVTRVGAQCAQVLASAVLTWRQESIPLAFAECSEPMIEDLKTMGIEGFILNGSGRQ